jgi:hypothetical protein
MCSDARWAQTHASESLHPLTEYHSWIAPHGMLRAITVDCTGSTNIYDKLENVASKRNNQMDQTHVLTHLRNRGSLRARIIDGGDIAIPRVVMNGP